MPHYAHELVAEIAKEIAGTIYEDFATDSNFYQAWPKQNVYIKQKWKQYVPAARATLVDMLADPNTCEARKEDIHAAILLDRTLPTQAKMI